MTNDFILCLWVELLQKANDLKTSRSPQAEQSFLIQSNGHWFILFFHLCCEAEVEIIHCISYKNWYPYPQSISIIVTAIKFPSMRSTAGC